MAQLKEYISVKKVTIFAVLFMIVFFLNQFFKMPIEHSFLNSEMIKGVHSGIIYLFFLCLPNIVFYFLVGIIISIVMKSNLFFWASVYCVIELFWLLFFLSPLFFKSDFFGYLLIFLPKIIIPVSVALGVLIFQKPGRVGTAHNLCDPESSS